MKLPPPPLCLFIWDWGSGCLEIALSTRLASACLCFPSAGIEGMDHHCQFEVAFSFEKKYFELVLLSDLALRINICLCMWSVEIKGMGYARLKDFYLGL